MQEIESTLAFVKGFFQLNQSKTRIKVVAAIQDSIDNEEPPRSIKAVGKVMLLGYQYQLQGDSTVRQAMVAIGKNRTGTLHVRISTEKIRDMYPTPGEPGQAEILAVLNEAVLCEKDPDQAGVTG